LYIDRIAHGSRYAPGRGEWSLSQNRQGTCLIGGQRSPTEVTGGGVHRGGPLGSLVAKFKGCDPKEPNRKSNKSN